MKRCFCCASSTREEAEPGWTSCASCGAMWCGSRSEACATELRTALNDGAFPPFGKRDWFMDAFTARIAGTAEGLWYRAPGGTFIEGHDRETPRGTWVPLDDLAPVEVELVALARPDDLALPSFLERGVRQFERLTLVLDAPAVPAGFASGENVRMVARPLDRDFGAQRNAGQAAIGCEWSFHLDLDETVDDTFVRTLGQLARAAMGAGLKAVGFPRRNFVDGALSDLFPDVQYRLLHRSERFTGHVHERPAACSHWPLTTIALQGAIEHHLSREHVVARDERYDALGQHEDRHRDRLDLLRAFANG